MGLKDIFINAGEEIILFIFQVFETALGGIIRGLLQFLTDVITRTPYPKQCPQSLADAGECTLDNTPLVFGVPQDALWGNLYSIYVTDAQPFAYVLWMFALISVQFSGIFDGLVPGIDTEESKKKLMVAFLGITLWWPAGVMILGFSDAFGTLLLELGTPGEIPEDEKASIGLARTYDVVMANLENNLNIHGLIITTVLWFIELLILMVLAILWFIRVAAIYILMPLMPVWIALWALEIPGLKPLQKLGKMQITMFNTLAFITIPGALIVGFYGTIIDIAARYTEEVTGASVTTDGATGGHSYDGSVSQPGVIESQPSATADPVGSFSSAVQPDPATTSAALDAGAQAQAGEFAAGYIASFVFAIVIMSLPLVAGLAPVLMAKSIPGGKEILGAAGPIGTALGGPAGAIAGAAISGASKVDKATGLASTFKTGATSGWSEGLTDGDDNKQSAMADALGLDIGGGSSRIKASGGTNYAKKIKGAMTKEGVALGAGAAVFGGKKAAQKGKTGAVAGAGAAVAGAGTAREYASDLNQSGRKAAWSAFGTGMDLKNDPRGMAGIASKNAIRKGDKVIGARVAAAHDAASDKAASAKEGVKSAPGAAASSLGSGKDRAVSGFNTRVEAGINTMHEVKTKAELEARVSSAKDTHMRRAQYEAVPDERHLNESQKQMAEDLGYVDDYNNVLKGMDARPSEKSVLPDNFEAKTAEDITDQQLEEQFGASVNALQEMFEIDPDQMTDERLSEVSAMYGMDEDVIQDAVMDASNNGLEDLRREIANDINDQAAEAFKEQLDDEEFMRQVAASRAGTDALYREDYETSVLGSMEEFADDWNVPSDTQDRSPGDDPDIDFHEGSGSTSSPSEAVEREIHGDRMFADLMKEGEIKF